MHIIGYPEYAYSRSCHGGGAAATAPPSRSPGCSQRGRAVSPFRPYPKEGYKFTMSQSNTTPAANSAPLTPPAPPAPSALPPSFALPLYRLIKQNQDYPTKEELAWLSGLNPVFNAKYPWNDVGNARLFADYVKATARYVPERKQWYIYDGMVWKPDIGGLKVMELCKRLAQALNCYAPQTGVGVYVNFIYNWDQFRYRKIILRDAASVYPVSYSSFDDSWKDL